MFPSVIEVLALTRTGEYERRLKKKEKCTNEHAGFTGPTDYSFDRIRYLNTPTPPHPGPGLRSHKY